AAVPAGSTGVVIKLPEDVHDTIAGVVVSLGGQAVPNVKVTLQRDVFHVEIDGGGSSTRHANIEGTVTDERGAFTLRGVPAKGVYLRFDAPNILPREVGRADGLLEEAKGDVAKLRIEVSVRCHLQIDLSSQPDFADQVSILDDSGRPAMIDVFLGGAGRM